MAEHHRGHPLYRHGVVGVLGGALAFVTLDRIVLGVVLQDIKLDLALSDTQLGLLSGIAFAFFYAIVGIPIARWADRGDRITILSLTIALFAVSAAFCGLVTTFLQLLLVRVLVAIGEAGVQPIAGSLIGSLFERTERPRATAAFAIGAPLASVLGFFIAGWLNDGHGWRFTFIITALPGLALAAVARLCLTDPRASAGLKGSVTAPARPSLIEVARTLAFIPTLRRLALCVSVLLFFLFGIFQWLPSFLARSYGLSSTEIGFALAITWGISGVLGAYSGGRWAVRWAAGNEALQFRVQGFVIGVGGLASMLAYLAPTAITSLLFLGVSTFALATINGPINAAILTLVPEQMRATAIAILFMLSNLIGLGFGPLAVGILSDSFGAWAGQESLRWALVALSPGYLIAAWLVWSASRSVSADVVRAERISALAAPSSTLIETN